jgi:type VI secretion system protein ImpM
MQRATGPDGPACTRPGWYGKLAVLGDFAHRRLPAAVVQRVDDWLVDGMAASRSALGDAWLDAYLSAPVLRFAWTRGVVDGRWWFGVLMPSCDNVGRYYPLLVASTNVQPPQGAAAIDRLHRALDAMDRAATATLDEGATLEAFEAALRHADIEPVTAMSAAEPQASRTSDVMALVADAARTPGLVAALWWHTSIESGERNDVAWRTSGIPAPAMFARLLLSR